MNKPSPLQRVKSQFGTKDKLVEKLTELLEPDHGESRDEMARRLKLVANAKLLHLLGIGEKVKALGGREALAEKIAALRGHAKDKDFISKLETRTLGQLLDMHASLSKSAAKAS